MTEIKNFAFGSNAFTDGNFTLPETIHHIREAGYEGINILADAPLIWPLVLDKEEMRLIQDALTETDLVVTGLNGFTAAGYLGGRDAPPGQDFGPSFGDKDPKSRALKVDFTKKVIDLALEFKTTEISIGSGFIPEGIEKEVAWVWMREAIEEAVQYAEAKDVHLNIESEPRLLVSTPQDVERLTTEIPSYALGINADIGHWYVCEEDVSAWIRKFGKRIRGADIEDIGLKDGKPHHHHLVPGKGVMPLADIFEAFRYIGFEDEHWFTIELYRQSDRPVEVAVETMTWLRNFEREMG